MATPHSKLSVTDLEERHRCIFATALSRVVNSDVAESTYAQIADGAPLGHVFRDRYNGIGLLRKHPVKHHKVLCPGSIEKAIKFQDEFKLEDLKFGAHASEILFPQMPDARSQETNNQ